MLISDLNSSECYLLFSRFRGIYLRDAALEDGGGAVGLEGGFKLATLGGENFRESGCLNDDDIFRVFNYFM